MKVRKLLCPNCGGSDIKPLFPRGILDSIMMVFNRWPFRCRRCERRFYRNTAPGQFVAPQEPPEKDPGDSEP